MSYIGNSPTTAAFLVDTFSGTGSQTAFTMTVAPANTSSILVSITGVVQDPSTYSVSGTTLTFSAAPPSGTSNISVRYLGIPASGVTTTAYRTVTNTTATAGQTSFTIPSYTVGYVDVYRNGVYLPTSDYTATTGTTVVLNNAATVGDTITTVSFYVSSVLNAIPNSPASVNTSNIVTGAITPSLLSTGAPSWTSGGNLTAPGLVYAGSYQTNRFYQSTQPTNGVSSVSFTGIPSWVQRLTLTITNISAASGTPVVYIGSGSYSTTGYTIAYMTLAGGSTPSTSTSQGWTVQNSNATGQLTILNLGSNVYTGFMSYGNSTNGNTSFTQGFITLSGALDRIQIQNSSNFNVVGYVTVTYEG